MTTINGWLEVSTMSGSGTTQITLTAPDYTDIVQRTASLRIEGVNGSVVYLTAAQEQYEPPIVIEPSSLEFGWTGGTLTLQVNSQYSWTLEAPDWVQVSPSSGSSGASSVQVTAEVNMDTNLRAGILTFKNESGATLGTVNLMQSNYVTSGIINCIYETKSSNQEINLFGINNGRFWYHTYNGKNTIEYIIIDGKSVSLPTTDSFNLGERGEHQVLIKFINNELTFYPGRWASAPWEGNEFLKKINISNEYTVKDGVGDSFYSHGMFYNCSNLEEADLNGIINIFKPNNPLTNTGEEDGIFSKCDSLRTVKNFALYNNTDISDYSFYNCPFLSSVTLYNYTEGQEMNIGQYAFADDLSLNGFNYDYINNSWGIMGKYAFENCRNLTGVLNLSGYTDFGIIGSVGNYTFSGCSKITEVHCLLSKAHSTTFEGVGEVLYNLDNGVTNLSLTKFKKVINTVPLTPISTTWFGGEVVESIEFRSIEQQPMTYSYNVGYFSGLKNLKELIFYSMTPPLTNNNSFLNTASGGTLYYPEGADYSQLLSGEENTLGYYGWTGVTFKIS